MDQGRVQDPVPVARGSQINTSFISTTEKLDGSISNDEEMCIGVKRVDMNESVMNEASTYQSHHDSNSSSIVSRLHLLLRSGF